MNESVRPGFVTMKNNGLFGLMKDKAILYHGIRKRIVSGSYSTGRNNIQDFMTWVTLYGKPGKEAMDYLISQAGRKACLTCF